MLRFRSCHPYRTNIDARIQLQAISGNYNSYSVSGMDLNCEITNKEKQEKLNCEKLHVANAQFGVPIKDLSSNFQVDLFSTIPNITAQKLEFQIFSGSVRAAGSFRLAMDSAQKLPVDLVLEGLNLQEILQAKQGSEFNATGTVDGKLPLQIDAAGVHMEAGNMHTRGGGSLQYKPDDGGGGYASLNAGLRIAIQAMQNFQYDQLSADLSYAPEGLLDMQVHLKGKNPDFQKGKRIDFNINLEENILALIKSLSLAENIGDEIDDRVQSRADEKSEEKKQRNPQKKHK